MTNSRKIWLPLMVGFLILIWSSYSFAYWGVGYNPNKLFNGNWYTGSTPRLSVSHSPGDSLDFSTVNAWICDTNLVELQQVVENGVCADGFACSVYTAFNIYLSVYWDGADSLEEGRYKFKARGRRGTLPEEEKTSFKFFAGVPFLGYDTDLYNFMTAKPYFLEDDTVYTSAKPELVFTFKNPETAMNYKTIDQSIACTLFTADDDTVVLYENGSVDPRFSSDTVKYWRGVPGESLVDSLILTMGWDTYDFLPEGKHRLKSGIVWTDGYGFKAGIYDKEFTFKTKRKHEMPSSNNIITPDPYYKSASKVYTNSTPDFVFTFNNPGTTYLDSLYDSTLVCTLITAEDSMVVLYDGSQVPPTDPDYSDSFDIEKFWKVEGTDTLYLDSLKLSIFWKDYSPLIDGEQKLKNAVVWLGEDYGFEGSVFREDTVDVGAILLGTEYSTITTNPYYPPAIGTISKPDLALVFTNPGKTDFDTLFSKNLLCSLITADDDTVVLYDASKNPPVHLGFTAKIDSFWHEYAILDSIRLTISWGIPECYPLTDGWNKIMSSADWNFLLFAGIRGKSVKEDSFYVGPDLGSSSISITPYPLFAGKPGKKPNFVLKFINPDTNYFTDMFTTGLTCTLFTVSDGTVEIYNSSKVPPVHTGFTAEVDSFWREGDTILDSLKLTTIWDTYSPLLENGTHQLKATSIWNYLGVEGRVSRTKDLSVAALSGGQIATQATPTSPSNYTNRIPDLKTLFSLFVVSGVDTSYLEADFYDTNVTVVLSPREDTLFNKGVLKDGISAEWNTIGQGKVEFGISWDDTTEYLPLSEDTSYNYKVEGGVWNYQNIIIKTSESGVDNFLVEGVPPVMEIWGLNVDDATAYVSANNAAFVLGASDAVSGVNTDSFFIDLYEVDYYGEVVDDSVEDRSYLERLELSDFDTSSGSALIYTGVEIEDGQALDVFVYNGRVPDREAYVDSATAYPDSLGPMDRAGNQIAPLFRRFYVDGMPPNIRFSSDLTHQTSIFEIFDTSSGFEVNASNDTTVLCAGLNTGSLKLYEDPSNPVSPDSTMYNSSTGVYTVYYNPSAENVWLMLEVLDKVGNKATYRGDYEDDQVSLVNPHNYPNPFSPVSPLVTQRTTVIDPGLTKTTNVKITIDIYDLAGHYVASVESNIADRGRGYWDGRTKDGTLVANGVYLCYIQVRDTAQGKTLTEVIKIAVAKNNVRIF